MYTTYLVMHLRKDLISRTTVAAPGRTMCRGNTSYSRSFSSSAQSSTGGRFYQLIINTMGSYKGEMDSDITMLEKVQRNTLIKSEQLSHSSVWRVSEKSL